MKPPVIPENLPKAGDWVTAFVHPSTEPEFIPSYLKNGEVRVQLPLPRPMFEEFVVPIPGVVIPDKLLHHRNVRLDLTTIIEADLPTEVPSVFTRIVVLRCCVRELPPPCCYDFDVGDEVIARVRFRDVDGKESVRDELVTILSKTANNIERYPDEGPFLYGVDWLSFSGAHQQVTSTVFTMCIDPDGWGLAICTNGSKRTAG